MLFAPHELAFRTQYAELKERVFSTGPLLPGTPGSLALRRGTGHSYWYRVYYPVPGRQSEELVAKEAGTGLEAMRERMAMAEWVATQVSHLRKLGFQVADKAVARVLVQLHNEGAFEAGLVLVGTLGYMAILNEIGVRSVTARTMDIDLARGHPLKLTTGKPWLDTLRATGLPFTAVPGMPGMRSPTAAKLPGADGVRVDLLSPGATPGKPVAIPELSWHAQGLPYYDYLLEDPERGAMLAGGHCIPVRLPRAARFAVHKLFSAAVRRGSPEKAEKDRRQALTLMAALAADEPEALSDAFRSAPRAMVAKIKPRRDALVKALESYPEARDIVTRALR